jgi:hypothetical protein
MINITPSYGINRNSTQYVRTVSLPDNEKRYILANIFNDRCNLTKGKLYHYAGTDIAILGAAFYFHRPFHGFQKVTGSPGRSVF